ncbi:hypothetical protein D3OALGA1CA_937 [Olavius algarvensis associated proteobacterium Delta 3]|nr:hypothetical protein D3OALGA1CA_937 [Olavius algarvensis associated proteobacterium Delta 3]
MVFNVKGLARFVRLWIFDTGWTPRRRVILAAFFLGYPLLEGIIWAGLLLDDLLFRGYRRYPVPSPVFIIGNHRSGTTFLHRLLSRDRQQFATMKMWEILLAPSITQRRAAAGIAGAARWFRETLIEGLKRLENDWHEKSVMHDVSFQEPEEDDYLLLHIWSALTTGLSSGLLSEAVPYTFFDTALPDKDRHRIMGFYRQCIRRHMFADRINHRLSRTYLAKNPAFSPKVATARRFFPDAKFIYLVRNPLEMIPSFVSMMRFSWDVIGIPGRNQALVEYIMEMARHWYRYPLQELDAVPEGCAAIVTYDDLTQDPDTTVHRIYRKLNLDMGPDFADVLNVEATRSRSYKSRHHYDLHALGLSRKRILDEFRDVFDRFGFDTTIG